MIFYLYINLHNLHTSTISLIIDNGMTHFQGAKTRNSIFIGNLVMDKQWLIRCQKLPWFKGPQFPSHVCYNLISSASLHNIKIKIKWSQVITLFCSLWFMEKYIVLDTLWLISVLFPSLSLTSQFMNVQAIGNMQKIWLINPESLDGTRQKLKIYAMLS